MENKIQLSLMYGKFGENNKQKVVIQSKQIYNASNLYPYVMKKGDTDSIKKFGHI